MYTLKTVTTYRVPTVADALSLRRQLERSCTGELVGFSYTTKYVKAKGEIIDEYQLVKATIDIDNEKEPEGVLPVVFEAEDF